MQSFIKSQFPGSCIFLHPVDTGQSDSTLRNIDNSPDSQIILAVIHRFQIGQQILDLPSGIEVDSSYNLIWNVGRHKLFFKHTGLRIGAIQNSMVMIRSVSLIHMIPDILRYVLRLIIRRVKLTKLYLIPFPVIGPECLIFSPPVITDHCIGSVQNIAGGSVVLFQFDHLCIFKFLLKIENIFDIGSPEFIDRLVIITNHTQVPVSGSQQLNQAELYRISILILIYHDISKAFLIILQNILLCLE